MASVATSLIGFGFGVRSCFNEAEAFVASVAPPDAPALLRSFGCFNEAEAFVASVDRGNGYSSFPCRMLQ